MASALKEKNDLQWTQEKVDQRSKIVKKHTYSKKHSARVHKSN